MGKETYVKLFRFLGKMIGAENSSLVRAHCTLPWIRMASWTSSGKRYSMLSSSEAIWLFSQMIRKCSLDQIYRKKSLKSMLQSLHVTIILRTREKRAVIYFDLTKKTLYVLYQLILKPLHRTVSGLSQASGHGIRSRRRAKVQTKYLVFLVFHEEWYCNTHSTNSPKPIS